MEKEVYFLIQQYDFSEIDSFDICWIALSHWKFYEILNSYQAIVHALGQYLLFIEEPAWIYKSILT